MWTASPPPASSFLEKQQEGLWSVDSGACHVRGDRGSCLDFAAGQLCEIRQGTSVCGFQVPSLLNGDRDPCPSYLIGLQEPMTWQRLKLFVIVSRKATTDTQVLLLNAEKFRRTKAPT